jgi:hypothetical protein
MMAKYDHGGGCPCGLYKECPTDCEHHLDQKTMRAIARAKEEASLALYRQWKAKPVYDWVPVGYTAKLDYVGDEVAKVSFEELRDPGWAKYVPDNIPHEKGFFGWDVALTKVGDYDWIPESVKAWKPRVRVKAGSSPWPVWAK